MHQNKEKGGTVNDKTNATYETTDAQTRRTALERPVGKLLVKHVIKTAGKVT